MKIEFGQNMSRDLKFHDLFGVLLYSGAMLAIIFIAAGRWDYWNGWLYFLLYCYYDLFTRVLIPSELVRERTTLVAGTKKWDYVFFAIFPLFSNIIPLVAALDGGRFHWTGNFPLWVNALSFLTIFLGYSLFIFSLRQNRFFAATVRIQTERGHHVIDKGPYAFIRHPGYTGFIIAILAIGFGMNSLWTLIPAGLFALAFIIRTYLEDLTLQKELPGYQEYAAKVRYRLLPGIW